MRALLNFISAFLILPTAFANIGAPPDVDYYKYTINNRSYIFPKDYEALVRRLDSSFQKAHERYAREFNWNLDEETSAVFLSDRSQIANAFATVMPYNLNGFYGGGAPSTSFFAIEDWSKVLVSHETVHLYQINVKDRPSSVIKTYFGNIWYFPIVFYPLIWVHPNMFLPNLFTEGNAVWNESRWGEGGRLHSGEIRAIVLAVAKADLLTPGWLINPYLDFPFSTGYYLGGFFYDYLAKKYSHVQTNSHFTQQARSSFWPFLINRHFSRGFGVSLPQALQEFAQDLKEQAVHQQAAGGKEIAFSLVSGELTATDTEVHFLATEDLRSRPWLFRYNKQSGQIEKTETKLPFGPVFFQNGQWLSASSNYVSRSETRYALFADSGFDEATVNRYIFDRQYGVELSFDIPKSYSTPILLKDAKETGIETTSARIGPDGTIFHFRQKGAIRSIYANDRQLYSFEGFYGKAVDVSPDGEFDFIANTKYGSSLFTLKKDGSLKRRSVSDRIVDARRISKSSALVAEVSEKGYHYKVIDLAEIADRPYSTKEVMGVSPKAATAEVTVPQISETKVEDYNGFFEMRFGGLQPYFAWSSLFGIHLEFLTHFVDPMQSHRVDLGYGRVERGNQSALISYTNTASLLGFSLTAIYKDSLNYTITDANDPDKMDVAYHGLDSEAQVGMRFYYPLYKDRHRIWNVMLDETWKSPDKTFVTTFGTYYSYAEFYGLNALPYREFVASAYVENELSNNRYFASVKGGYDLGSEWVVSLSVDGALSQLSDIEMSPAIFFMSNLISISSLYNDKVKSVAAPSLRLDKVLNWPLMFYKFPLGIRRWVPFVEAKYNYVRESLKRGDDQFPEYSAGLTVEIIFNHKFVQPISVGSSTIPGRAFNDQIKFNAQWDF